MIRPTLSLAAALAVLLPLAAPAAPGDYTIVDAFPSPLISPDGLAWDGAHLWITQCQSTDNYALDPVDGHTVASSDTPFAIDHLAWDGSAMWATEAHTDRIHRLDGTNSRSQEVITAPTQVMGLAWADDGLWVLDPSGFRIYRLEDGPESGFPTPGDAPCGLGWDGQCFWAGDLRTKTLNLIDPGTGEIVLTTDAPGGPARLPTGFTWDGTHLWVNDEDPTQPTVYRLDVEFPATGPCARPDEGDDPVDPIDDSGDDPSDGGDGDGDDPSANAGDDAQVSGCASAAGPATFGLPLLLLAGMAFLSRRRS